MVTNPKGYVTMRNNIRTKILKSIYGNKCNVCNCNLNLEFAHIKPTNLSGIGRGRTKRLADINKNRHCYSLLCHSCHNEFDHSSEIIEVYI